MVTFSDEATRAGNSNRRQSSTNVTNKGWTLKLWTKGEYAWTDAVQANLKLPALKPSEITRINEAVARSKLAVEYARDAMIDLAKQNAIGNVPSTEEQLYLDFFGAFDKNRAEKVLANYKTLYGEFSLRAGHGRREEHLVGHAMLRGVQRGRKVAGLEVFVGRGFFLAGGVQDRYDTSCSSTVGTLIHEFAHGSFKAVDAPPVDGNGNWVLQPMHLNDPDHDDYGASPDNAVQASTIELDKALAAKSPDVALRNADSYCEFALLLLTKKSRSRSSEGICQATVGWPAPGRGVRDMSVDSTALVKTLNKTCLSALQAAPRACASRAPTPALRSSTGWSS